MSLEVPVLAVRDLRKIYPRGERAAVDGISFEVASGEILGFLGPNGSGKTTTIQMLLGTLALSSGSIQYCGKDLVQNRTEVLQYVSFASAYAGLPWALTAEENLTVFGRLYGLPPEESRRRYEPLLQRFGIIDKRYARITSLSAGQVTRLMLVKAFFVEPKIVLLDEPTASLDPDMANGICDFIIEERDRTGLSVVFTSHRMEEVSELCDRVIFLKEGKIVANDIPKNLALSVSEYRVRLLIVDGMKRTVAIVNEMGFPFSIDHRSIEVMIPEGKIPSFLNQIGQQYVAYASISIQEPSLEDYFLHMARSST